MGGTHQTVQMITYQKKELVQEEQKKRQEDEAQRRREARCKTPGLDDGMGDDLRMKICQESLVSSTGRISKDCLFIEAGRVLKVSTRCCFNNLAFC